MLSCFSHTHSSAGFLASRSFSAPRGKFLKFPKRFANDLNSSRVRVDRTSRFDKRGRGPASKRRFCLPVRVTVRGEQKATTTRADAVDNRSVPPGPELTWSDDLLYSAWCCLHSSDPGDHCCIEPSHSRIMPSGADIPAALRSGKQLSVCGLANCRLQVTSSSWRPFGLVLLVAESNRV